MKKDFMSTEIRFRVPEKVRDAAKKLAERNGESIAGFARRAVMEKVRAEEDKKEAS